MQEYIKRQNWLLENQELFFNALAKENKSQSSVRFSKNLQEKLMGSSSQCRCSFLLLEMTTNTVPHETISS